MKLFKLFSLIVILLVGSCSQKESVNLSSEMMISIENETLSGAKISWTKPESFGSLVSYRILVNNEVVAENIRAQFIILDSFKPGTTYTGTIFALDNEGNETFSDFTFTTLKETSIQALTVTSQQEIDNFFYISVGTLIVKGSGITNLKGLSTLKRIRFQILIEGTNIESLEGLENIIGGSSEDFWPQLKVHSNQKLKDISDAQNFVNECVYLSFLNNSSLTNFMKLEIPENSNLILGSLPLMDLKSIVFPKELKSLEIWRMPNLKDLTGLENLETLYNGGSASFRKRILLKYNPKLKSVKGLENLDAVITATDNESLVDYCALKQFKGSILKDNLYNPKAQDLEEGKCKQ